MSQKQFGTILRDDPKVNTLANQFTSQKFTKTVDIPPEFDGRVVWENYLSPIKNQGKCNACYSYAVVGSLADRFAIQTLNVLKPDLNPLETAMCMYDLSGESEFKKFYENPDYEKQILDERTKSSCFPNSIYTVARYMFIGGAVDEDCVSEKYLRSERYRLGYLPSCYTIEGSQLTHCQDPKKAQRGWYARSYYKIGHDSTKDNCDQIKLAILKFGPIVAGFYMYDDFLNHYDGKSIYVPKEGQKALGGHAVRILGWGQKPFPHWIAANSWGTEWGEKGYFKIVEDNKMLQLEINNVALWPDFPGYDEPTLPSEISEVLPEDREYKDKYEKVNPNNMYREITIDKIKKGEYYGDLNPILTKDQLPKTLTENEGENFWAYKVPKGTTSKVQDKKNRIKSWVFVLGLMILIGFAVFMGIFIHKKHISD